MAGADAAGDARKARGEEREFPSCRANLARPASLAASPMMNRLPAMRGEMVCWTVHFA
jgi:hypothetical protein